MLSLFKKITEKFVRNAREESIFELFTKLSEKAKESVLVVNDVVKEFCCSKKVDEYEKSSHNIESKADEIVLSLTRKLYEGRLLPYSSEDWFSLAVMIDDVIDRADRVVKLMNIKKIRVPKKIKKGLLDMSEKTIKAVDLMNESIFLLKTNLSVAKDKSLMIKEWKEEIRSMEYQLFRLLYKSAMKNTELLLLKEIIYNTKQISDLAEDVGNRIHSMAIKYSL